jgi:hypothetical protein
LFKPSSRVLLVATMDTSPPYYITEDEDDSSDRTYWVASACPCPDECSPGAWKKAWCTSYGSSKGATAKVVAHLMNSGLHVCNRNVAENLAADVYIEEKIDTARERASYRNSLKASRKRALDERPHSPPGEPQPSKKGGRTTPQPKWADNNNMTTISTSLAKLSNQVHRLASPSVQTECVTITRTQAKLLADSIDRAVGAAKQMKHISETAAQQYGQELSVLSTAKATLANILT